MEKTMRFLSMAALALVGALMTGCSSDEDTAQESANTGNVVTLKTTLSVGGGEGSRALSIDEESGEAVKTFAEGDVVALLYTSNSGEAKAVSVPLGSSDITNGGKSATFTFNLTDPQPGTNITYYYPAAMLKYHDTAPLNGWGPDYEALITSQDGTLEKIASDFDLCTTEPIEWSGGDLPGGELVNQLAILAITLKDATGQNDITSTITDLTVPVGYYTYTISRTAASGPIYVAVIPPYSETNIVITAADGTTNYTKSMTGKVYEAGTINYVSWRMTALLTAVDLGLSSGTKWANMNIGATSEEDYGDYFAWAATEPWYSSKDPLTWKTGKEAGYVEANTPFYDETNNNWEWWTTQNPLGDEKDAANVNWSNGWKMPTQADFAELLEKTTVRVYLGSNFYKGVHGIMLTSKLNGKSIFLPAAGYRNSTDLKQAGARGYYLSKTNVKDKYTTCYLFYEGGSPIVKDDGNRGNGYTIRAVKK